MPVIRLARQSLDAQHLVILLHGLLKPEGASAAPCGMVVANRSKSVRYEASRSNHRVDDDAWLQAFLKPSW